MSKEAFEKWFEADAMLLESNWFIKDEDGKYAKDYVYLVWKGWQAAISYIQEQDKLAEQSELVATIPAAPTDKEYFMNDEFLHKMLLLLACEQMQLHDSPSNYLAAYPVWTERTWALENIIWRYKLRS